MFNNFDNFGDRMKGYEEIYKNILPKNQPLIIRIDGKAFHTYTKSLKNQIQPYNTSLIEVMNEVAIKLCKEIQGAQIAYVQSDEISIFVHNYKNLKSEPWFSNEIQKIISISAGIASATFTANSWKIWKQKNINEQIHTDENNLIYIKPAYFDSRVFIIPEMEISNYFYWRQKDNIRNSIQLLARSLYSHKECSNKNNSILKEMCAQKGRSWDAEPHYFKFGRCIIKEKLEQTINGKSFLRTKWIVDNNIPIFFKDKNYIEKYLIINDSEKDDNDK